MASVTERHRPEGIQYLAGLDGLRAFAVAAVFLLHSTHRTTPIVNLANPVDHAYWWATGIGWAGVDLFFVLSGFLITGILLDARGAEGYFRAFYIRRFLRIFPLYYLTLAFTVLVLPVVASSVLEAGEGRIGESSGAVWVWTYLTNLRAAVTGPTGLPRFTLHFWSLAVEEQFYVVWPLVVLLFNRKSLLRLCIGIIVGSLVLRIGLAMTGSTPNSIYYSTLTRLDPLALGAAIACVARGPRSLGALARAQRPVLVASIAALLVVFVITGSSKHDNAWMVTIGFSALAFASGAILVMVLTSARAGKWLEWGPLAYVGRRSYAIYIFHPVILSALKFLLRWLKLPMLGTSNLLTQIAFSIVAWFIVVIMAEVSWRLVEAPILSLKRFAPMPRMPKPGLGDLARREEMTAGVSGRQ